MRLTTVLPGVVMAMALLPPAHAEVVQLQAVLEGIQAVPPTASPGSGVVNFELDTDTATLTLISGSYQDLIGELQMVHVHGYVPPGEQGTMLFMLQHDGGHSGSLSLMTNPMQLKEGDVQGLIAGLAYVNLHTTIFVAGEIRGQIYVVPAPAGFALLGVAGATLRRRRRHR